MSTLDAILSRLEKVHEINGGYQACCPAHDDRHASLSICESDGRILVHCHAGCSPNDVVEAIGLKMRDLFSEAHGKPDKIGPIVATYDYVDAAGDLVFQVTRHSPKTFLQRRPDGSGGWLWNRNSVKPVPYHLPKVVAAVNSGATIFIAEGEKDCHSLEKLGFVATCNPGGAGKWRPEFSQWFGGGDVVLLPDNDDPGRDHAQDVARKLSGAAKSIKVVDLPDLPPKGDVTDWMEAGGTADELLALVESAPEWTPAQSDRPKRTRGREKADPGRLPGTDLQNAELLISAHGRNLRYDVDAGKWLTWNSVRWEHDTTGEADRRAMKTIRALYDLLPNLDKAASDALYSHIKRSESRPRLEAMVALAQWQEGVPVQAADLDHDPMLLNCLNGTLDLRSGNLRPHTREDMITKLAPVEYDATAKCPRWTRFLEEVFEGDGEVIGFVKRMVGYFLGGDTREQTAFILCGKGSNGKSTFVEVLRAVLGDYAADTPFSTFLERRDSNTADLAGLRGKRLVTASEGEEAQTFHESLLKAVTGGDPITCRHLYRDYFSYTPTFKVVFSTNEIPRIKSQNHAMKRRLKLVPFRQRFYDSEDGKTPVKDPALLGKLLEEKSGILAWAVEGCLEWRKIGLATPAVIRAEVERLFESQDPLAEFLDQECEIRPDAEVEVGDLWKRYLLWCEETGRRSAFKQTHFFSRSLQQRDGIDSARRHGGVRVLTGIGLRDGNEPDPDDEGSESDFDPFADPHSESRVTLGDAKTDFSETSPMKGEHDKVSENTDSASPSVTRERENAPADQKNSGSSETKTACETRFSPERTRLLAWAEKHGWQALKLGPSLTVGPGEGAWRSWVHDVCNATIEVVLNVIRRYQL